MSKSNPSPVTSLGLEKALKATKARAEAKEKPKAEAPAKVIKAKAKEVKAKEIKEPKVKVKAFKPAYPGLTPAENGIYLSIRAVKTTGISAKTLREHFPDLLTSRISNVLAALQKKGAVEKISYGFYKAT